MIKLPDSKLTAKTIAKWNAEKQSEFDKLDLRTKEYMRMYIQQYMDENSSYIDRKVLLNIVSLFKKIEGVKP